MARPIQLVEYLDKCQSKNPLILATTNGDYPAIAWTTADKHLKAGDLGFSRLSPESSSSSQPPKKDLIDIG
jgi:hypothetical protein